MTKRFLCALLVLAVAPPAPAASAAVHSPFMCGGLTVVTTGTGTDQRARITGGRSFVATIEDEEITNVQCRPNVAGPRPALLVETYTGGSHCCVKLYVYAADPFRRVLAYDNGVGGWEFRAAPGGAVALVFNDGHFDYYRGRSHADSPDEIPPAACFLGGAFVDCTRSSRT